MTVLSGEITEEVCIADSVWHLRSLRGRYCNNGKDRHCRILFNMVGVASDFESIEEFND